MKRRKQNISKDRSIDQILRSLNATKPLIRSNALESLAKMNHENSVSALIAALNDTSPTVRWTAAQWLGLLGKPEGIGPLIRKLSDPSAEVRMRAAESLGILLVGQQSPSALIQGLRDPDELVRIEVADSLGAIGDRSALRALWRAVRDPSPLVRSFVAGAIGELGTPKDISRLERELRHEKSDRSKVGFYQALHMLGNQSALAELLKLLENEDYNVRCATANALCMLRFENSRASLIVRALRKALRREPSVAAKSSIQASIRTIIKKQHGKAQLS